MARPLNDATPELKFALAPAITLDPVVVLLTLTEIEPELTEVAVLPNRSTSLSTGWV